MEFLLVVLAFVLAVMWILLSGRMGELRVQMEEIARARNADREQLSRLTQRLHALETARVETAALVPVVETVPEPERPPIVPPVVVPEPPVPSPVLVLEETLPQALAPEPVVATPPPPTMGDRLRERMGEQEWEATIGGNWLNKIGVLILVIGIALFLGYEFTRVGPLGRVAIGYAVSVAMLGAGVLWERKPGFSLFGRGLLGGGWAALYFTTYAIHAVSAAKVIDNPFLATALLLTVAAGMILHSLRYKSETVTGVAYFVAFATLALSESTTFSVLAMLPLAGSLLFLAHRFRWHKMAVFGLFATYAVCATREDTGAKLSVTQGLFASYWLLFEAFDLLRLRQRTAGFKAESLIAPLNALGFFVLSLVKWHRAMPANFHWALLGGAVLYLCVALLHAWMQPPSSFENETGTMDRMAGGGYEFAVTVSAMLAAAASVRGLHGQWVCFSLLMEGELLFLVGMRLAESYLRRLSGAVFAFFHGVFVKMVVLDGAFDYRLAFAGHQWIGWSPVAGVSAATFYLNRWLRGAAGFVFSSVAAAIVTTLLGFETPERFICVAWLGFATLLFEFGFFGLKREFRIQAYAVGALGTVVGVVLNEPWLPLGLCALTHYALALQVGRCAAERMGEEEKRAVVWSTAVASAVFGAILVWKLIPAEYLGLGWLVLGTLMFELGLLRAPEQFRRLSYPVSLLGCGVIAWEQHVTSVGAAAVLTGAVCVQVFRFAQQRMSETERAACRDGSAALCSFFTMALAALKLPSAFVALAWMAVAVCLIEIGVRSSLRNFRWMGHVASVAVLGRLWVANFDKPSAVLAISQRTVVVVPIIATLYYVWARCKDSEEAVAIRVYSYAASALAVVLCFFELSENHAALGWAVLGLAVYGVGRLRDFLDLRVQGYFISGLAFVWTWGANFANAHSPVTAGVGAVACFYAAQLMTPIGRIARTYYLALAAGVMAILLFYEVSGGMLTVAWGIEALVLLGAGFPLRDRWQRLAGLFLFLVCVMKLFLYDLRNLETMNRIVSFIVLGLLLVGISWMYTRFRERIKRYL